MKYISLRFPNLSFLLVFAVSLAMVAAVAPGCDNAASPTQGCGAVGCTGNGGGGGGGGGGGDGSGSYPADGEWELVFEDNFNSFDDELWDYGTHTFGGNAAHFRRENISYSDGKMILTLKEENYQGSSYTGGELRTDNETGFHTYGRFVVRMKAAKSSGVISSFFTYRYNPWQEIDIEFLGEDPTQMSTNIFYNDGPEGAPNNDPNEVGAFPIKVDLGYDASEEFHEYAFEWEPGELRWYVDGELVQTADDGNVGDAQTPGIQMQIMMNLWASSSSFGGPIDDSAFPVQAEYDYVRFYQRSAE